MISSEKIQEIEKATGIQGLQAAWESTETVDVVLTKTKHFTEQDYNILYDNLTKQAFDNGKYEEAKVTGEEMAVKNAKRKKELDFEGKSVDALVEFYEKKLELANQDNESELKKNIAENEKQYLKNLSERDKTIEELNNKFKNNAINNPIDSYFDALQIEVPANIKDENEAKEYIKIEKQRHRLFFKSMNQRDIDEHGNVVTLDNAGKVLKDDKLQPIPIDIFLKEYTEKSFVNLKQDIKGRGEGDRRPQTQASKFNTRDDLDKYAREKGIHPMSNEFSALLAEFNKNSN